MFRFGFSHQFGLLALCRAWRNLIELTKPDLFIAEYGAALMLATVGMGIPRVRIGTGATAPPLTQPKLSYEWWKNQPMPRLADIENAVLKTSNSVLQELGQKPITTLHEMFKCEAEFILGNPALDHFPQRQGANYCGPILNLDHGIMPAWPSVGGKRVFAYIKTSHPHFGAMT